MEPVLRIKDLTVAFHTYAGELEAIDRVSLSLYPGETLGIVGESGCGKSVTAQSILQLHPPKITVYKNGHIYLENSDLLQYSDQEMNSVRGKRIGMIFQDPMTSLNPVMTIGEQIAEGLCLHHGATKQEGMSRALELLKQVRISSPEKRLHQYAHELSGGMRQRCMIAIALACNPQILIADEPTTALDVTTEAQILTLLRTLQKEINMATLLISHNLGIIAQLCQRVIVMYSGRIVEEASVTDIFDHVAHPYTKGLLASLPNPDEEKSTLTGIGGHAPDLFHLPTGCRFHPRCPQAMKVCATEAPPCFEISPNHKVYCWLYSPERKEAHV